METTEEYFNRIGSHAALEDRKAKRLLGKLNKPLPRRPLLAGKEAHSLYCKCDECIPPWLKEEMKSWPIVTKGMYERRPEDQPQPMKRKPVTKLPGRKEPKRARRSWVNKGTSGN